MNPYTDENTTRTFSKDVDAIFIPKGQIHRIIKGQTDLKLKIEK
jgi:hypothetical protein